MGDGSMTTLTIADPEKPGIADFLNSLPSRFFIENTLKKSYMHHNLGIRKVRAEKGPDPICKMEWRWEK